MEKEPQLDVLRARGQEKKRVRERGCGTETMAAQACRRVGLCQTRSSNRFFFGGIYLLATSFLPILALSLSWVLRRKYWVKFRLVLVIATPNLKIENRGRG